MTWVYRVTLDRDDDGDTNTPDEDITQDVLEARWRVGMADAEQHIAEVGWARVTVWNEGGAYDGAGLPMGAMLRITAHHDDETLPLFTGFLVETQPEAGDWGQQRAILVAMDALAFLKAQTIALPPQMAQTSDAIVRAILAKAPLRPRALKGYWLLGREAHGRLGTRTRLPIPHTPLLETGRTRFAYAGDAWDDGMSAYGALAQVAEAERGRVFVARDGTFTFYNRQHTLAHLHVAHTLHDDVADIAITHNRQRASRVQVCYQPRVLGAPNSLLWQSEHATRCPPHARLAFSVRWCDATTGQTMGALDVLPLSGVQINSKADGTGQDTTAWVTVRVLETTFTGATLEIINPLAGAVFLLAGIALYGTPVLIGSPASVRHTNPYSHTVHGARERVLALPLLDTPAQADNIARFELGRASAPRTVARTITLVLHDQPARARATLFDRVRVQTNTPAHDDEYVIVAEEHTLSDSASTHRAIWTLETATARDYWVVGARTLAHNTRLAY